MRRVTLSIILLFLAFFLTISLHAHSIDGVFQFYRAGITPVIDGIMDDVWKCASTERMIKFCKDFDEGIDNYNDMYATVRAMWDEENTYLFFQATDDKILTNMSYRYENDSYFLFFDGNYSKLFSYDNYDDIQIMIMWTDTEIAQYTYRYDNPYDPSGSAIGLREWEYPDLTNGYAPKGWNCEVKLPLGPLNIEGEVGSIFGFETTLNDNDCCGREGMLNWWGYTNSAWNNSSVFGVAQLSEYVATPTLQIVKAVSAPTIDGELDAAWIAPQIDMTTYVVREGYTAPSGFEELDDSTDFYMSFRAMWDDENLYFFVNVIDETIYCDTTASSVWEQDGVEICIDGENNKNVGSQDVNDREYRWIYSKKKVAFGAADGGTWAWKATHDGYNFELKLPNADLLFLPEEGHLIGLEVQVNDNDGQLSNPRENIARWWGNDLLSWSHPEMWGTAQLVRSPSYYLNANFSASPMLGSFPLTVQFTNNSSGEINNYLWDFGDGTTSTLANPNHTYQNEGVYTVSLTVSGSDGTDTETKASYITVLPKPCILQVSKVSSVPIVDGKLDPIWENITNIPMEKYVFEDPAGVLDLSGSFRLLWGNNNLYLFISIKDDIIRYDNPHSWECDGIELYFDGDNSKMDVYDGQNDIHLRFQYPDKDIGDIDLEFGNGLSWEFDTSKIHFTKADTEDGWNLEISISLDALRIGNWENSTFGFEIQYDDNDTGYRNHMLKWWCYSDNTWHTPALMGTAQLFGGGTLEVSNIYAIPGSTILVPVRFIYPAAFSSAEITIGGYFGLLDFIEIDTSNSLTGSAGWTYQFNETDNLLISAFAGAKDISDFGTLLWLKFVVPQNASGFIPIAVESAIFNTGDIPLFLKSGGITIPSRGDVDLNGLIQAYDASLILKCLVNYIQLDEIKQYSANVSGDNTISTLDASLILQYVVQLINHLPYSVGSSMQASGNVSLKNDGIQAGQEIVVPIYIQNGENILGIEGEISFNPEHLTFKDIPLPEFVHDFTIETNCKDGLLKFAGMGSTPYIQDGALLSIIFQVNDNFSTDATEVLLKKLRLSEGSVQENVATAVLSNLVAIEEANQKMPESYSLNQNYPNPFNPVTTIQYGLPTESNVVIQIYNIEGKLIETLIKTHRNPGYHTVQWNATGYPSGIYFYKMQAVDVAGKGFQKIQKMMLLK